MGVLDSVMYYGIVIVVVVVCLSVDMSGFHHHAALTLVSTRFPASDHP